MDKITINQKLEMKRHAIALEKNPNRLAELKKDEQILLWRLTITDYQEKIEHLQHNK